MGNCCASESAPPRNAPHRPAKKQRQSREDADEKERRQRLPPPVEEEAPREGCPEPGPACQPEPEAPRDEHEHPLAEGAREGQNGLFIPSPSSVALGALVAVEHHRHTVSTSNLSAEEEVQRFYERQREEKQRLAFKLPTTSFTVGLPATEAVTVLFSACRPLVCGSLACPELFAEVLDDLPAADAAELRRFSADFPALLTAAQREGWCRALLGVVDERTKGRRQHNADNMLRQARVDTEKLLFSPLSFNASSRPLGFRAASTEFSQSFPHFRFPSLSHLSLVPDEPFHDSTPQQSPETALISTQADFQPPTLPHSDNTRRQRSPETEHAQLERPASSALSDKPGSGDARKEAPLRNGQHNKHGSPKDAPVMGWSQLAHAARLKKQWTRVDSRSARDSNLERRHTTAAGGEVVAPAAPTDLSSSVTEKARRPPRQSQGRGSSFQRATSGPRLKQKPQVDPAAVSGASNNGKAWGEGGLSGRRAKLNGKIRGLSSPQPPLVDEGDMAGSSFICNAELSESFASAREGSVISRLRKQWSGAGLDPISLPGSPHGSPRALLEHRLSVLPAAAGPLPDEYGFGDHRGGLLQGSDEALRRFCDENVGVRAYLHEQLQSGAVRRAFISANGVWCRRYGWMTGSSTEIEEKRSQLRLLRVIDRNLDARYGESGEHRVLIAARAHLLAELRAVCASQDDEPIEKIDEALLQITEVCASRLARVPTNYDAENVRLEYVGIVRASRSDAGQYLAAHQKDASAGEKTRSKYGRGVLQPMNEFIAAADALQLAYLDHAVTAGSETQHSASMTLVPPTMIPVSAYDVARASHRDAAGSWMNQTFKGFESFILRTV
ncbi:hypothetical protein DIPPA_02241 [Diplonema papillatum]|nr:hypothetical protein DIPPA_02241 [Diplonema papillatum]